jgi:hypothetical protein
MDLDIGLATAQELSSMLRNNVKLSKIESQDFVTSVEWFDLERTSDMEADDGWFNLCDESQSLDTLPPSYEDAIRASEDARNDMDVTLQTGVDICTSDSYDWNHSSGNLCTSRGMMISISPLMSQNTGCIESGADAYQFSMDGMPLKPWSPLLPYYQAVLHQCRHLISNS